MSVRFASCFTFAIATSVLAQSATQQVIVPSGVPLHLRVTHTAKLRIGAHVEGVLTQPIFVGDRLVFPVGSPVRGSVSGYAPLDRTTRAQAWLNGDVTPLHDPVVAFTLLHLDATGADITLDSQALIRDTQLVRFIPATHTSLLHRAKEGVVQRVRDTREVVLGPNKKDRALRLFYGQLPYHPQRIWVDTKFIADLTSPAVVTLPAQPLSPLVEDPQLDGLTVNARLATGIDSKGARKDDTITAIVTQPLFNQDHQLLLPEGSQLTGSVSQARAARSLGRNGALRFAIRGVDAPGQPQTRVYGTLRAAEGGAGANVTVDDEGNVKANPDKNRFVAPLLLAITAASGHDDDRRGGDNLGGTTVASNGFGLAARIVALTVSNQNVATGFGYYALAKSIYFRFLTRGHEVSFPKDTQIQVQLQTRKGELP